MIKQSSIIVIAALTLVGCGNSSLYSGDVYTAADARTVRSVTFGTVESVRPVRVQTNSASQGAFGAIGGAVVGGLLGNTVGGGSGQALATAGGAIAGSAIGSNVENRASQANAVELQIKRDDGSTIVVVQTIVDSQFFVGQRVRLVGSNNSVSVSPL